MRKARERLGPAAGLIGVNIGKNKDTDLANAAEDYLSAFEIVHDVADYVTVNISSPNTAGLRDLQESAALRALLTSLKRRQAELQAERGRYVPLAAKVAPDLDDASTDALAEVLLDVGIDGCIATNTTISRPVPEDAPFRDEAGGLSGRPLHTLALTRVARLARSFHGRIPIVGVGGIHDVAERAPLRRRRRRTGAGVHRLHLRRPRPGASGGARARRLADRWPNQYAFGRVEGSRTGV